MGAGASASQVREHVEGLGNAYQPYGTTLEDNGVDGALGEELAHDDRAGVNATFDDLGITNKLHRRKLLQAARAQHGVQPDRPRSGSSIGSVEGPAIAVAEDLLADAAAAVAQAAPAVAAAAPAAAAAAPEAEAAEAAAAAASDDDASAAPAADALAAARGRAGHGRAPPPSRRRRSGGTSGASRGRSCLLYTSPSPRDKRQSRMPSSA
mgnify:CR=1 FL=1